MLALSPRISLPILLITFLPLSHPFLIPENPLIVKMMTPDRKVRHKWGHKSLFSMPPTPSMPPSPDEPEPFAVPGKTSALKDASDYAINAAITEAEYLHSSSAVPAKGKLSDAMCYRMQTEAKELMERYDFKGAVELLERVQLERKDVSAWKQQQGARQRQQGAKAGA